LEVLRANKLLARQNSALRGTITRMKRQLKGGA
jgi:hypothetical protein